ncbi:glycosyltransferase family 4 protein [Roseateles sp. DC23W]|uniref:Glycosyltransferase family 4 protein n=1 Tax=Pelomonas dachongensis TaxID=3299029 RepID=A0ABW7ESS6_9BURK
MSQPTYLLVVPWALHHVGGVNQVVLNLARSALRDGRFRPLILIADWNAREPIFEEFQGISTVRWRIPGWTPRGVARAMFDRWISRPRFNRRFAAFCVARQVELVNCHYLSDSTHGIAGALAAQARHIPLVISVHGTDITTAKNDASRLREHRALLEQCTAAVAPSHNLAERCHQVLGLSRRPEVIHNGVDTEQLLRPPPKPIPPAPVVLSIGKFERQKGQDVLLQAFAALATEFPEMQLWLVGANAAALQGLRSVAAGSTFANRVHFHIDVPHAEIPALFRAARLFVLPSRQEAFGIVLLEAGCLGVPVIATHVGGVPEIITDGETGLLVPPDDLEALAEAIRQVLRHPAEAQARAARLAARVQQQFSWRQAFARYIAFIQAH